MSSQTKVLLLFLLAASALPNSSATVGFAFGQDEPSAGSGTLGVLIITKEGMVLAADSRTTYNNGQRHDDRAVKSSNWGMPDAW